MGQVIFEDNVKFKAKKEKQLQAIKELTLSEFSNFLLKQELKLKQDKIDSLETTLTSVLSRLDALESN